MAERLKAGVLRICGIDPGIRNTGWGVVEFEGNRLRWVADGVVRPDTGAPDAERLHQILVGLSAVIEEHGPGAAAIEEVFVSRNPASVLKLGMARGAAMLSFALQGIPVAEIAARRVKQNVTGSGRAEKGQVAAMVTRLLQVTPGAEDSADALAIAIAAANDTGPDSDLESGPSAAGTGYAAAVAKALEKEGGRTG